MRSEEKLIDQDQRDRAAQDLSQSYIVEAAAGTGKTTLLVSRIIHLIREGEAALGQIIAITFTEKAAAELKVKLRQELERALAKSSEGDDCRRMTEAISDLERMQVTTIHSFCASLLRERPVEAGLDPNFEVADDLTASLVQAEVWEKWLEKQMDGNDPALRRAVLIGMTPEQMRTLSKSMLENRDVLEYQAPPQPLEQLDKAIGQFIGVFQEAVDSLNQLKPYSRKPEDKAVQMIETLDGKLKELESPSEREEREIFIFNEISVGPKDKGLKDTESKTTKPRNIGNKTNWKPQEHLNTVNEHFTSVFKAIAKMKTDIAESVMRALAIRLKDYNKAYEETKQERNLLDFHDLLICARDMLKKYPEVRRYFRQRYKFLMVDEFQDTDPLQAEIVFFLSEDETGRASEWRDVQVAPGRLFLVGDPKQSIYRFRRADIEMYEDAKNRMGPDHLLTISQNFRCAPSLVQSVNRIFQDLIKPPDAGQYQPVYVPLHLGRKKGTVPSKHGTVLLYPPRDQNVVIEKADGGREWESRCIASFIRRIVSEEKWQVWDDMDQSLRPVMFRDIAILFRAYKPLDFLERALGSYEVDYRVVGGKYFYKRQEVEQLLVVLRVIDNPNDKVALVAALRSPFFGVSDEELFLFHADGGHLNYLKDGQGTALEKPFGLLRELHEMRNRASIAVLLKRLYEETRGLVLFLMKPQGEQRVANLLKIGDVARALDERGMLSFRGFVRWLSERQEEGAEEGEPPTVERGDNFVRLMTIHKAKGLEFPVIVLADLAHEPMGREDFIIDRSGKRIAIKTGNQEQGFWTSNYKELSEWEEKRGEAEERRLLYVGMTRARDFLVLPVYWVKDKKNGEKEIPKGSFLDYLKGFVPTVDRVPFGEWKDDTLFYDTDKLELKAEEMMPFRYPLNLEQRGGKESKLLLSQREQWKEEQEKIRKKGGMGRSITTAIEQIKTPEEVEKDDEWMISPVTKGEGAIFGKLVHRLFEKLDWSRPDLLEEMAVIEGKAAGASGPMVKKVGEMVRGALHSPILQRVMKSGSYQKEVPFTYKGDGTMFEGVMDLVFKEGDGLVVLDFKTDSVKKDELNSKIEHYQPQVKVYSDAIKTIFGNPPKEVILFFLHLMEPVSVKMI